MEHSKDRLTGHEGRSLCDALEQLERAFQSGEVHTQDLAQLTGREGLPLVTLLLALPFIFPIPLPGLSIPFGIIIVIHGIYMLLDREPWLPKRFQKVHIPKTIGLKVLSVAKRITGSNGPGGNSKLKCMVAHPLTRTLTLCLVIVGGFLLALPLPPGTNVLPGLMVAVSSLALLRGTKLFVALSLISLALNISFFGALWWLGYEGVLALVG